MKKWLIISIIIVLAAVSLYFFVFSKESKTEFSYKLIELEKSNVEAIISTTGTLNPVNTVEIGSQISGNIAQIYVDFNDQVKRGQLIARIDDTFLKTSFKESEAALERIKVQQEQAQYEHDRNIKLFQEKAISEQIFKQTEFALKQAKANYKSASAAFERAKTNLSFARIYSPIDGKIIQKNISEGQTVAASFSAPILFLIAEDLSQMEILANVDENDIGSIKEGQEVIFTVQAFEDEEFIGLVKQVRLQSSTIENVVNYKVVIQVDNEDQKLLPGMTANVDFLTETAYDVLAIPNSAFRLKATDELLAEVIESKKNQFKNRPDSSQRNRNRKRMDSLRKSRGENFEGRKRGENPERNRNSEGNENRRGRGGFGGELTLERLKMMMSREMPDGIKRVFYLNENGKADFTMVRTGVTDGKKTEIKSRRLTEGTQIIIGINKTKKDSKKENNRKMDSRRLRF